MACEAVQMWSLSGLVAAFLDLALAYLFLCASAVAYSASKFLGFFGLNLPCPCDGLFFNTHSRSFCLNRLLIDFPTQKVSDVQLSVKQKFPFSDFVCPKRHDYRIVGDNFVNGILELEGEASCSSVSDARRSVDLVGREMSSRADKYDMKGKGVINHKPRSRLRQRRRGVGGVGKYSSVSSYDEEALAMEPYSHSSTNKCGNGLAGDSSLSVDHNDAEAHDDLEYDDKVPNKMVVRQRSVTSIPMDYSPDEDMQIKQNILSIEEQQNNAQGLQIFSGHEKHTIRLLKQRLEEERIARASLYNELEKERSAAASAADEAMAMILRLQEEKASIEMEARQFQRIIEEKSAYDAEEMNILKEILLRREKEKHFLEKEVEAYRQMVSVENEQLGGDGPDKNDARLSLDPNDDPVLILRQLIASTDKKASKENKYSDALVSMDELNDKFAFGNESPIPCQDERSSFGKQGESDEQSIQMSACNNVGSMDLQEKQIISVLVNNIQLTSEGLEECKKTTPLDAKELQQIQEMNLGRELAEKIIVTCNGTETGEPNHDPHLVHDVHIIGHGINFCSKASVDKSEQLSDSSCSKVHERNLLPFEASVTKRVDVITDCPSTSCLKTEVDAKRNSSVITCGLPPIGPRGSSLLPQQRRRSMSAMDSEMLRIDNEVGRLRERLKLVQEGREKLSHSVENRERENIQLKLLEDIAGQIQEIRHLTGPGKAVRQVSLPLPNSKAFTKKKRSRSASSVLRMSSEG